MPVVRPLSEHHEAMILREMIILMGQRLARSGRADRRDGSPRGKAGAGHGDRGVATLCDQKRGLSPYRRRRYFQQRGRSMLDRWRPAIVEQLNAPDPAWRVEIPQVNAPTLVIAGGMESHLPQDKIADMAARFPAGRLAKGVLPGVVRSTCPRRLDWIGTFSSLRAMRPCRPRSSSRARVLSGS